MTGCFLPRRAEVRHQAARVWRILAKRQNGITEAIGTIPLEKPSTAMGFQKWSGYYPDSKVLNHSVQDNLGIYWHHREELVCVLRVKSITQTHAGDNHCRLIKIPYLDPVLNIRNKRAIRGETGGDVK